MVVGASARQKLELTSLEISRSNRCDDESTQARLMRQRGDLNKTAFSFKASLPAPAAHARTKGFGVDLAARSDKPGGPGECKVSLFVSAVDNHPRAATPAAQWNMREDRQALRGEDEKHASLAIKPGDKICAVNGTHGDDMAMVELLESAGNLLSPKPVSLTLQRACSDVLGPPAASGATIPSALPPRLPTSGGGLAGEMIASFGFRGRSNSNPEASRPGSRASDAATSGRVVNTLGADEWKKLLTTVPVQGRFSHVKRMMEEEDDVSTRANSVSSSGRSSSLSNCDIGASVAAPLVIKANLAFSRVGRMALQH